jgi:hypothetical protein
MCGLVLWVTLPWSTSPCTLAMQKGPAPRALPAEVRIRSCNMFMTPWRNTYGVLELAMQRGVLPDNVVLLCQEMWQMKWDPRCIMRAAGRHASCAGPSHPTIPVGKQWDSGLCALSRDIHVQCVGFVPFDQGRGCDVLAFKGAAAFAIGPGIVAVTMHLQSGSCPRIRRSQMQQVSAFALAMGAHVLIGDFNAEPKELQALHDLLQRDFPLAVCLPAPGPTHDHGTTVDHAFVLTPDLLASWDLAIVDEAVTRGWTDHRALDLVLRLNQNRGYCTGGGA